MDQRGGIRDQRGGIRDQRGGIWDQRGGIRDQRGGIWDQRGGIRDQRGGIRDPSLILGSKKKKTIFQSCERFAGEIDACVKLNKAHGSAPGLLHISRESQKTPEKFEIPASVWLEKCFFFSGQSAKTLSKPIREDTGTLSWLLTRSCFHYRLLVLVLFVQRTDQFYREFATFFPSKMSMGNTGFYTCG